MNTSGSGESAGYNLHKICRNMEKIYGKILDEMLKVFHFAIPSVRSKALRFSVGNVKFQNAVLRNSLFQSGIPFDMAAYSFPHHRVLAHKNYSSSAK